MITALELDEARFRLLAQEISNRSGKALDLVMHTYGRRTVELCIRSTPPFNFGSRHSESGQAQKKVGLEAVKQGVKQAFRPWPDVLKFADEGDAKKRSLYAGITRVVRKRNWSKADYLVSKNLRRTHGFVLVATKQLHSEQRRKGRVPGNRMPYIIPTAVSRNALIRYREKKVGFAKSGWIPAAIALGSKLTGFDWIKGRGGETYGGITLPNPGGKGPREITVWNGVPYIQQSGGELRIVEDAMQSVTRNMQKEADVLAAKGYWQGQRSGRRGGGAR